MWHTAAVACFLAVGAFAGHWALARLVLGQLDAALVALAETEASALEADPRHPLRVHEFAPGTAPPSFVRLDRFVQIVDLDGNVLAKSANLGTARLPAPQAMLERLKAGEVVFETFEDFGEEPIRVAALPINAAAAATPSRCPGSLDDAYGILNAGRWLFLGLSLLLLAGVAVTTVVFARRALRPVDEIVAQARRIGESNLAERLPQPAEPGRARAASSTRSTPCWTAWSAAWRPSGGSRRMPPTSCARPSRGCVPRSRSRCAAPGTPRSTRRPSAPAWRKSSASRSSPRSS